MVGIDTFISGVGRITREFWQFWRRRLRVFLKVEHEAKGPMLWTAETLGHGRPKVEQLVIRVVLPSNADAIQIEDCGRWAIGKQSVRLDVDYGSDGALPYWIKPGDKYEWYTDLDNVQKALRLRGMTGNVRIQGVVHDVAHHGYKSKSIMVTS